MKRVSITFVLTIIMECLFAQASQGFHRYFDDKNQFEGGSLTELAGKKILVIAGSYTETALLKTDIFGNLLWSKKYSSTGIKFMFRNAFQTGNNSIYLFGQISNEYRFSKFIFCKSDTAGNIQWAKKIYKDSVTTNMRVIKAHDNNFIIASSDSSKIFLTKIDTMGNILWSREYSDSLTVDDRSGCNLIELADHSLIIAGNVYDRNSPSWIDWNTYYNGLIMKTDSLGNIIWSKKLFLNHNTDTDYDHITCTSAFEASDGSLIITLNKYALGYFEGLSQTNISVLDKSGNLLYSFDTNSSSYFTTLSEKPPGIFNILAYGRSSPVIIYKISPVLYKMELFKNKLISKSTFLPNWGNLQYVTLAYSDALHLSDNRFAFAGNDDILLNFTDSTGYESCTSKLVTGSGFPIDTLVTLNNIKIKTTSVVMNTETVSITDTLLQLKKCTCDSTPKADFSFIISGKTISFTNSSFNAKSYQWYFGDNSSDTASNPTHTFADTINRYVMLKASNNCGDNFYTQYIVINDSVTSIYTRTFSSIPSFRISPNPAKNNITIEPSMVKPYTIHLLNLLGETIYYAQETATVKTTIDVGTLPKGIYIVQLIDKSNNSIGRQRLIIQ